MTEPWQQQDILWFIPKPARAIGAWLLGTAVLVWSFGPGALGPCILAAPLFALLFMAKRRQERTNAVGRRDDGKPTEKYLV